VDEPISRRYAAAEAPPPEAAARRRHGLLPMSTSPRRVHLAGEELRDRHVVLLGDGLDEFNDILVPFIVEGIESGDRVFHIVDPALRDAHLEHLSKSGIDVPAVTASGQLEVRTWNESYLVGGSFDPRRQFAYLRERVTEGRGLGFPATRLIGSLDWAVERPEVMPDVLAYETRVDTWVRNRRDVVVCTYDLRRHGARAIADVLGLHSSAVVGGVTRTRHAPERESARDRLLTAASRLFRNVGIRGTGVDALIVEAGVAKATFYRHFPSKDDLVVAWLRDSRARWLDDVRANVENNGTAPAEAIPRFFEALADWLEAGNFRGCPYLNSSTELADPSHPARAVITDYLQAIEDYLTELATEAGHRDPRRLGAALQTLAAGAITLGVARRSTQPACIARDAARGLLAEAPLA
jgi:AcrR family transcriptional regulator